MAFTNGTWSESRKSRFKPNDFHRTLSMASYQRLSIIHGNGIKLINQYRKHKSWWRQTRSLIPLVRRVDTIEELVACFEGNTPCISSHLGVYDFENLTDDKWIADNVGDCNIRFRRPTNRKVIDPSDSIKEIAIALQTHTSSLRKFIQSEDNTLVLTGVETHVLKKER